MYAHPLFLVFIQTLITAAITGFTPAHSAIRWGAFPLIVLCVGQIISTSIDYLIRSPWAGLVGGHSVTLLFQYIDLVLLRQWSIESRPSEPRKWTQRLAFGLSATWNSRFAGTQEQVKNVPPFSNTDPSYVPTREVFLRATTTRILLSYIVLDVIGSSVDPELSARFLTTSKVPVFDRLGEISGEEIIMRVCCVVGATIGLVCTEGGIYSLFALVSVLLGISEPRDWPPFYGSVSEACTLRGFWRYFLPVSLSMRSFSWWYANQVSCTWHQSDTHKLNSISRYVTYDLMGIRPHTPAAKSTRIGTVFGVSAYMHFLIDISAGIHAQESGAIRFFSTQTFGLLAESLVSYVNFSFRPQGRAVPTSKMQKALGYAWVAVFLVWSLPAYIYPMMYRSAMGLDDSVVPVSLVRTVFH